MRTIEDALEVLNTLNSQGRIEYAAYSELYDTIAMIETEPVKHGHWVEVQRIHEADHTAICECSLCGDTVWVYDGQRAWNYCPKCGAMMDGERREDGNNN